MGIERAGLEGREPNELLGESEDAASHAVVARSVSVSLGSDGVRNTGCRGRRGGQKRSHDRILPQQLN